MRPLRKERTMLKQEEMDRLNALARKQKTSGLTEPEKEEQQRLREAYLKVFREQFRQRLENIDIVYKD